MDWQIEITPTFKALYSRKDSILKARTDRKIETLQQSENPLHLGSKKKSLGFYALDISRSHRIAYDVEFNRRIISLLKVCSHKQVYGKD